MAQVNQGSCSTTGYEGRYLKLEWSVDSTSIADNTKKIYWSLVGAGTGQAGFYYTGSVKVVIDGKTVYTYPSDDYFLLYEGTVVASGYTIVTHDTYGNKTLTASVEAGIYNWGSVNCRGSGSWELQTIPRYASITQLDLSATSETSITFSWNASKACDASQYSLDGGAWLPGGWPSVTISGLTANTTYSLKIKVRAKDSQLWTESETKYVTTYSYPYCTNMPNFVIGNTCKIDFYNPLGREFTWQLLGMDDSVILEGKTTGATYSGVSDDKSVTKLYQSIPNSKSGIYKVKAVYADSSITKSGGVYWLNGTEIPQIDTLGYFDNNSAVVEITGNNQHIVQNYSSLVANISASTTNYAGRIMSYTLECNGYSVTGTTAGNYVLGAVNSANDVDLKLTVTDSRGMSTTKTIKVDMVEHEPPKAVVTLQRLNNYEDETYLTVKASIASVDGKNLAEIKYRYKVSGGEYGSYASIENGVQETIYVDKNSFYVFNVMVTDIFGATFTNEYSLGKGLFPLFIDTEKQSVGINCFPQNKKSLEINGLDVSTITEFRVALNLEAGIWTDTGIQADNILTTGTYVMEVAINGSEINGQYVERISGIVAWLSSETNSTNDDVIPVSKAGHARNDHNIQLRVLRTSRNVEGGGMLKLQIMDDISWTGDSNVVFKFKRMI